MSSLELAAQLLEFLRLDLAKASTAVLFKHAVELEGLPHLAVPAGQSVPTAQGITLTEGEFVTFSRGERGVELRPDPDALKSFQTELRQALSDLTAGQPHQWPLYPEVWFLVRDPSSNRLVRRYQGKLTAAIYAAVEEVLVEMWPQIRVCADPACGSYFLYSDPRQTYCSKTCSYRVRQARHRPRKNLGPMLKSSRLVTQKRSVGRQGSVTPGSATPVKSRRSSKRALQGRK